MTIVQNQAAWEVNSRRRGRPAAIGACLPNLGMLETDQLTKITFMEDPADRARHAARVSKMMRGFGHTGTENAGRQRRRKLLDIIETFARMPPVTIDVPRIVWRDLYDAAASIAAMNIDWDSRCGPLIAASNDQLKFRIGWTAARKNIRRLAEYGLIIPHCLAGNGKRFLGSRDSEERSDASAWSLAPLLLLEDYLTQLAATEKALAEQNLILPKEIRKATSSAYRLLRPFEQGHPWADKARKKLDAIAAARRTYQRRKGSVDAIGVLGRLAEVATRLLDRLSERISLGEIASLTPSRDTRVRWDDHHQYSPQEALESVYGLAEGACRQEPDDIRTTPDADRLKEETVEAHHNALVSADTNDVYGIQRSGFVWAEAPALFPFIDGMVEIGRRPGLTELHEVARVCQIGQATAARASATLGTGIALLCALITGHHLANGQIRKTPDAYMQALVRRARSGELNLGHTLLGRRKAVFGQGDTRASNMRISIRSSLH
jgi:replication initiation protein RepC